jgi:hypothetical protein
MRNLDKLMEDGRDIPVSRAVAEKVANPAIPRPLTLGVISRATGMPISRLSGLLTGRKMIGLWSARLLCVALGLTLDELFQRLQKELSDTPAWRKEKKRFSRAGAERITKVGRKPLPVSSVRARTLRDRAARAAAKALPR